MEIKTTILLPATSVRPSYKMLSFTPAVAQRGLIPLDDPTSRKPRLVTRVYTIIANFSTKYLVMCKVYTVVGGIN